MNNRKEDGVALVFTLMIVTLVLLFILVISNQILNTNKQITKMEKQIISEQIAQMGVDFYRAAIKKNLPKEFNKDELKLPNMQLDEVVLDNENNFAFLIKNPTLDETEMVIRFTSVGKAYDEVSEIESSIIINIVESGE
ncbi:hypothetical protein [Paucisalibacillus sp. EB02]|uniref:hypothetical protein n=1 Tax=Paucisalibacillus sp. EB02 TaxID=1347087 RepID=UPI0004B68316|nr:hypothetical protein [Paucisalibacillus sp. EB02]